jgi:hypothetical protein
VNGTAVGLARAMTGMHSNPARMLYELWCLCFATTQTAMLPLFFALIVMIACRCLDSLVCVRQGDWVVGIKNQLSFFGFANNH